MDLPEQSTPRPSSDDRANAPFISPTATSRTNNRSCHQPQRSTILTACQAAALFTIFFLIGKFISTNIHTPKLHHCGQTPPEAKTHNCIFDPMTYSWLPRLCHNENLTAEFLDMQHWQWYLDPTSQREADRHLVLAGEYEKVYVTWDYRRHQCVFAWRKLHRAAMEGMLPDSYTTDWERNMWCEDMLERRDVPLNSTDGFVRQGFSNCGLGV